MITIHHLLVSQSERVIWLMEELGLPYELKSYPRDPQTRLAHPVFRELHPIGAAPVIQDGAVTMAESLAIFSYILDLHGEGKLRVAPGAPGYADYVYWFHYANAGLMPQMMMQMALQRMAGPAGPASAMMQERFERHLKMIEARLAAAPWLAGETFTAADILLHFPFGTMRSFAPLDISAYPATRAWLARISARPAYRKAMKLAGHTHDPADPATVL